VREHQLSGSSVPPAVASQVEPLSGVTKVPRKRVPVGGRPLTEATLDLRRLLEDLEHVLHHDRLIKAWPDAAQKGSRTVEVPVPPLLAPPDRPGLYHQARRDRRGRRRVGLRDDDRTSALLILASGVDPNLAASATVWCSRATIRGLMIRSREGVRRAGGLVLSHAIGP
jgi:hypothetical protein